MTILTAGLLQIVNDVYGFRREFSLADTSIQHTHADSERVTVGMLAVYAFVIPVVMMAVISLGISRSVWDFHAGLLGIVVSHAFALTATTIVKVCVGRPRPDFLNRCQPMAGAQNRTPFGLATERVCTTDVNSHLIQDGFRSFPSGHSSTAFAGLTFLTLWLAGKFHLWQRSRGNAFFAWLLFIPMLGATLIAVSRTMDYRHHATDVIAGGLLGFVIALSAYHTYYPPLWHAQSHKPWSPRTSAFVHRLSDDHRYKDPHSEPTTTDRDLERGPLHAPHHLHQRSRSEESQFVEFVPHDVPGKASTSGAYRDQHSDELELANGLGPSTRA